MVDLQISPSALQISSRHTELGLSDPCHSVHPFASHRIAEPSELGVPPPAVAVDAAAAASTGVVATVVVVGSRL